MVSLKKNWIYGCLFLILLCVGFVFRSCSSNQDKGKIYTIARDPNWYPSNLMGKEKNMTAFSDDLLMSVGRAEDFRFHINNSSSDSLISGLLSDEYDGVLTQLLSTGKMRETLLFSDPYVLLGPVLVTMIDSQIDSIEEMSGKTIGIESGSSTLFDTKKYPSIIIATYDNIFKALGALNNDKIDGVLIDAIPAHIYIKTFYPTRLRVATKPLTNDGLRLIAIKNSHNEKLIEAFNKSLKTFQENGDYEEMIKKWGLINTLVTPVPVKPINGS